MIISSPVKIHSLHCQPLMPAWCYLMDLYWFLHSTIYLNADFIKLVENKLVVNWEFLKLAAWPAVIFLLHLFCFWVPTAMWLFSFSSNQVWSVACRYIQSCISEWQRWDMRWVYAAGMLLPGNKSNNNQSCFLWYCVMVWVMALQKACKHLAGCQSTLLNVISGPASMSIVFCLYFVYKIFSLKKVQKWPSPQKREEGFLRGILK